MASYLAFTLFFFYSGTLILKGKNRRRPSSWADNETRSHILAWCKCDGHRIGFIWQWTAGCRSSRVQFWFLPGRSVHLLTKPNSESLNCLLCPRKSVYPKLVWFTITTLRGKQNKNNNCNQPLFSLLINLLIGFMVEHLVDEIKDIKWLLLYNKQSKTQRLKTFSYKS